MTDLPTGVREEEVFKMLSIEVLFPRGQGRVP